MNQTMSKTMVTTCELSTMSDGRQLLLLTTCTGSRCNCTFYTVARIACVDLAWQLAKCRGETGTDPEAESYAINLTDGTCECKGFYRHGHCKHLAAIHDLREKGALS